jgi:hypothetical protein
MRDYLHYFTARPPINPVVARQGEWHAMRRERGPQVNADTHWNAGLRKLDAWLARHPKYQALDRLLNISRYGVVRLDGPRDYPEAPMVLVADPLATTSEAFLVKNGFCQFYLNGVTSRNGAYQPAFLEVGAPVEAEWSDDARGITVQHFTEATLVWRHGTPNVEAVFDQRRRAELVPMNRQR